jgi:hypothetical protein
LLLTDGYDTTSKKKNHEVSDRAIKSGVAIYSIGVGDPNYYGVDTRTLSNLAESTGGRAFFPKKAPDIPGSVEQLGKELKACFIVSFRSNNPTPSTSGRKLKIEITSPDLRNQKVDLAYQRKHFAQ